MNLQLNQLADRLEPQKIILVEPDYYDVIDVKNPYMKGDKIDHELAKEQWLDLKATYEILKDKKGVLSEVVALEAVKDLEDMVFCANQSLPWKDTEGNKHVMLSNMRFPSRRKEIASFEQFYTSRNYITHTIDSSILLEGMGDCIFHPFKQLVWMGYGFRTVLETANLLESQIGIPVVPLKLVSEYFYHLDTCFLPANDKTVFLCKDAFDEESLEKIKSIFENVIYVSMEEATSTFCLNTHCIYNKEQQFALTPKGNHSVKSGLESLGYTVIEMDTSEFIKGGGSIFCMKMMFH